MAIEAPNAGNWNEAVIYQEEFFTLMTEVIQQFAEAFNEASAGAMQIVPRQLKGDFEKSSFFKRVDGLVRSRDPKSNADVADKLLEQDELIGVKVNRGIGPVAQTLDFWRKVGADPVEMSMILGTQFGEEVRVDYVNNAIASVNAALEAIGGVTYDATDENDPLMRTEYLNEGNSKLGDRAQRVRAYIMHSKVWHNLVTNQIVDGITNIADQVSRGIAPASLGKPVIITDSPELVIPEADGAETADNYITLGLVEGAVVISQSEDQYVTMQEVTGQENIVWRLQGEYAFNVAVRGCAYTGSEQPDTDDLSSDDNWDFVMHDKKLGPGVRIITE